MRITSHILGKAARPLALAAVMGLLAMTPSQATMCQDDVRNLGLTADLLGAPALLNMYDAGTAHVICTECDGILQVEVFLGPDSKNIGAELADGTLNAAALQAECQAKIPNCRISELSDTEIPATRSRHKMLGHYQTSLRFYSGGNRLTIRATSSEHLSEQAERAANNTLAAIKPNFLPPC